MIELERRTGPGRLCLNSACRGPGRSRFPRRVLLALHSSLWSSPTRVRACGFAQFEIVNSRLGIYGSPRIFLAASPLSSNHQRPAVAGGSETTFFKPPKHSTRCPTVTLLTVGFFCRATGGLRIMPDRRLQRFFARTLAACQHPSRQTVHDPWPGGRSANDAPDAGPCQPVPRGCLAAV